MPYSEAQKRATKKYKEKIGMVKLNIDVTDEQRSRYKAQAAKKGMSLAAYVTSLIEKDMEGEK